MEYFFVASLMLAGLPTASIKLQVPTRDICLSLVAAAVITTPPTVQGRAPLWWSGTCIAEPKKERT